MEQPSATVLTCWKDIAVYLGKGVRTVQRWEKEFGLPVKRPLRSRHVVIAIPAELDAWVASMQGRETPSSEQERLLELDAAKKKISRLERQLGQLKSRLRKAG
jgi:hypothetical protein